MGEIWQNFAHFLRVLKWKKSHGRLRGKSKIKTQKLQKTHFLSENIEFFTQKVKKITIYYKECIDKIKIVYYFLVAE